MGEWKGPKKGVGNKNSGRKPVYEEHNKSQAINTLWEKVNKKIQENEKLTEYEEKLVLSVLPKTIKREVGMSHEVSVNEKDIAKASDAIDNYINNDDTRDNQKGE